MIVTAISMDHQKCRRVVLVADVLEIDSKRHRLSDSIYSRNRRRQVNSSLENGRNATESTTQKNWERRKQRKTNAEKTEYFFFRWAPPSNSEARPSVRVHCVSLAELAQSEASL